MSHVHTCAWPVKSHQIPMLSDVWHHQIHQIHLHHQSLHVFLRGFHQAWVVAHLPAVKPIAVPAAQSSIRPGNTPRWENPPKLCVISQNSTEWCSYSKQVDVDICRCYYVDVCRCYVDLRSGLYVPVDLHNQSTGCNNRVWTNWASQPQEAANPQPFWAAPRSRKVSRTVASGSVAIHRLAPRHWPKQRSGSRYFWPCPVADFQPPRSRHWGANAARWQWLSPRGGTSLEVQIPVVLYMFISKSTGCSAQKKVENIENEDVSE